MDSERFDGLVRRFAQRASRRSVLKGLGGGVAVGALAIAGRRASADEHLVAICHKPGTPAEQTLYVAAASLDGHLGHGDYEGECRPPSQCPDFSSEVPVCFWLGFNKEIQEWCWVRAEWYDNEGACEEANQCNINSGACYQWTTDPQPD